MDPIPPAQWTEHADINGLLGVLLDETRQILGDKLIGLYLYGSLVTGDFDRGSSDIDLLAVTSSDIDRQEFARLDRMHQGIINRYQEWENRFEMAYLSAAALQTYRWRTGNIAIISPGEPFHVKEAGKDWLLNWYVVREQGIALFGPSPKTLIEPITREEFIQTVKSQVRDWREWV
ncbi:MAG TPA: nucleotidyltransferase domain-containing protein, partial [Chloroflexia bacterium]|nr:nucleotidyltransferase domain-containing protein [Chloroflexia bacterium]